ncbi:MAG: hypothetical protein ACLFR1_02835 [Spirochaetia bacterium]
MKQRICSGITHSILAAFFLFLPLCLSAVETGSSNFITLPSSTAGIASNRLWSANTFIGFGLQSILPQAQPLQPQFSAGTSLHMGSMSIEVLVSGIGSNFWGCTVLRTQLLRQRSSIINLATEFRTTLPSWTMAINPWAGVTMGQDFGFWFWNIGGQAGLYSAPMPNQRPLGPHLILNQYAGIGVYLLPWLSFQFEEAFAGSTGYILFGTVLRFRPVKIKAGWPINWAFAGGDLHFLPVIPGIQIEYALGGSL